MDRLAFDPKRVLHVSVERERFLVSQGKIVPEAPSVLQRLKDHDNRFGYELSACQVEDRSSVAEIDELKEELVKNETLFADAAAEENVESLHVEVGPEDMPLDIFPDPTGRYQEITRGMPRNVLLAACRVIGTHVHVGMPDHQTALRVYNALVPQYLSLCEKGNGSFGERLAIYRIMAPDHEPKPYRDWNHFEEVAAEKGFVEDPRKCWTLIRISKHGTIEFRMFGATSVLSRVVGWARLCHDLCQDAMA